MQIAVDKIRATEYATDLLVVGVYQGAKKLIGPAADLDKALEGVIFELSKEQGFEGKKNEVLLIQSRGKIPAKRVLAIGLGHNKNVDDAVYREAAATVIKEAAKLRCKNIAFALTTNSRKRSAVRAMAMAIAEGVLLGAYRYEEFHSEQKKSESEKTRVELCVLLATNAAEGNVQKEGVAEGVLRAQAVTLARDLVNTPSADMTPGHLVSVAEKIATENKSITLEVYDRERARELKMGSFLGVARGSDEPPYFIHLTYKPRAKSKKKIFLCGKGITFDTGGISLKPAAALEQWPMHSDMAGAAAILGVFSVVAQLGIDVEVHAALPCTENMPSGKALKPHDILRAMNGKTIEVLNTDAEGRLVLADALSFAVQQKADAIVDLATLTGACVLALGSDYAGLFSNDEKLTKRIANAANITGERVWAMPMPEEYKRGLKSPVADLKNVGPRMDADAITAALFLQEFVGTTPWVHLDIAGPAWVDNPHRPSNSARGTGYGVRLLLEYLKGL